jgi:hypothetical protein
VPTLVVLDPVAAARPAAPPVRERPSTLAGKRIGFLNNTKASASGLPGALEARLRERFELALRAALGKAARRRHARIDTR